MSGNLNKARQLHQMIGEILMKDWDPIGVSEIPEAHDEYDSYIPQIYALIVRRETVEKIFDYLWWAQTKNMELCGNRKMTELVAAKLFELGESSNIL